MEGTIGFLPLRFYCKELNIGARDLLQFKLPTLENLLRDPRVVKVVEDRHEFLDHLRYLSWAQLDIQPFLDVLGILQEVGPSTNWGKMTTLRVFFPSSNANYGWNSKSTLCTDNYWQIPNYPKTPTFSKPDPSARVISGQMIAMCIAVCKYAINHQPFKQMHREMLLKFVKKVFGAFVIDIEGRPVKIPLDRGSGVGHREAADAEEPLQLDMDEEEMRELLEGPPAKETSPLEGRPVKKPAVSAPLPSKSVSFADIVTFRTFAFGKERLGPVEVANYDAWPEMDKAQDVPRLEMSKATAKAMARKRCPEFIKRGVPRSGLPLVDERLRPGPCQKRSALKVKTHREPRSGEAERVFINHNDDVTWNFLAKLRHPMSLINSRAASPVPPYLQRRGTFVCRESLMALLHRQYDQDVAYHGRPLPAMVPGPVSPVRTRKQFPGYMTSAQIKEVRHLSQEEIKKKFGARKRIPEVAPRPLLPLPDRKASAQRTTPSAPPRKAVGTSEMKEVPIPVGAPSQEIVPIPMELLPKTPLPPVIGATSMPMVEAQVAGNPDAGLKDQQGAISPEPPKKEVADG